MSPQPVVAPATAALQKEAGLPRVFLWTIAIPQALAILVGLAGGRLGISFRPVFGDALFLGGALLLVLAGLLDITRSLTVAHLRTRPKIGDPPLAIRRAGRTYALVISGVLLCLEGVLLAHVF